MRERERRSLHKSICTSKKVNALSLKAEILYYRSITWEDDEGFQEADPRLLKHNLVPFRDDIPLEEIKGLILEICTVHQKVNDDTPLWNLFHIKNKVFVENPVANQKQSYHAIHKNQSEIKKLIGDTPSTKLKWCKDGAVVVQTGVEGVTKLSEVKLSKGKKNTMQCNPTINNPESDGSLKEKTQDLVSRVSKTMEIPNQDENKRRAALKEQAEKILQEETKGEPK